MPIVSTGRVSARNAPGGVLPALPGKAARRKQAQIDGEDRHQEDAHPETPGLLSQAGKTVEMIAPYQRSAFTAENDPQRHGNDEGKDGCQQRQRQPSP